MNLDQNDEFIIPNITQTAILECKKAFSLLKDSEKLYAHYLSKAAWYGGLIVLVQTSPESPLIFCLLHKIFSHESPKELYEKVHLFCKEEEFKAFVVYTCGIFANMGNYKSRGDTKFIPNLSKKVFKEIIFSSKAFEEDKEHIESLWKKCEDQMYSLDKERKTLGFPDKGVTTYFSRNCSEKDSEIVNEFLKVHHMEGYNTRTFKTEVDNKTVYEIRLASSEKGVDRSLMLPLTEFQGHEFIVTRNDYGDILAMVIEFLQKAKGYVATWDEEAMIEKYISSFRTGSLKDHKDGSRYWIRDKGPVIETYIGFIETYRDPSGIRGEFEGFVAMVNKEMSEKFKSLVAAAQTFIPLLPWNSCFEKDKFLQPDFTSLDVLTFAGSGIPIGINIPNYDEIRQEEGFKNVSLGNVIPAIYKSNDFSFLTPEDQELMMKYSLQALEVQVGLHELLGHGCGKLLRKLKDGSFNFDISNTIDPLTGETVSSWYEDGETYDGVFTVISSTYEECRAECVGLYLSLESEVLKIFGHEGKEAEDIAYVNWLFLLWTGAGKALELYQPKTKSWLQAHAQARYVIAQVILEAGEGLFTVEEVGNKESLLCKLDRTKLQTIGKEALRKFLLKLQVYKSTKNVDEARKMYRKYSDVSDEDPNHPWASWRAIIMKHTKPKKMFIQCNTVRNSEGEIALKSYENSYDGFIQSWTERFEEKKIYTALENIWEKDTSHFYESSFEK